MATLVPAIIPESFEHLRNSLKLIDDIHEVHIDIVDGKFVTPVSWPIKPAGTVADIASELASHVVEVDVMTATPITQAKEWMEQGVDMVVVHAETLSVQEFEGLVSMAKCTVGISALLDTPYEILKPYLEIADYTQVMGISVIGAQGQPFDERAIERVKRIAKDFPNLPISIDGSVNAATIPQLVSLPIDRFIVGSAIMGADIPEQAYVALRALLNHIPGVTD